MSLIIPGISSESYLQTKGRTKFFLHSISGLVFLFLLILLIYFYLFLLIKTSHIHEVPNRESNEKGKLV